MGSISTVISPRKGSAVAMAACSCSICRVASLLRSATNRAPPNSASRTRVPIGRFAVFLI